MSPPRFMTDISEQIYGPDRGVSYGIISWLGSINEVRKYLVTPTKF